MTKLPDWRYMSKKTPRFVQFIFPDFVEISESRCWIRIRGNIRRIVCPGKAKNPLISLTLAYWIQINSKWMSKIGIRNPDDTIYDLHRWFRLKICMLVKMWKLSKYCSVLNCKYFKINSKWMSNYVCFGAF